MDGEFDNTNTVVDDTQPGMNPDVGQSPMLDPKAFLKQQISDRMNTIHKKYESQNEILRSLSMPDEGSLQQDMAGELADLREMYKAKNKDLHSAGRDTYSKKLPALKASYHADQFRIQQKFDKDLRQMNRAYDQQKSVLARQQEAELSAAEQRSLYDIGHMHAIDVMEQDGSLTQEAAKRARFKIAGLQLPAEPDPAKQFSAIEQVRGDLERRLSKYSFQGGILSVKTQTDPTDPTTITNRRANSQEMSEWGQMERQRRVLQSKQIDLMEQHGLVPKSVRNAADYLSKGLVASVAGRTKQMGESMKSPPKTQAQEPNQPRSLDRATAANILKQAGGDKDKARQLATSMGYTL